MKINSEQEMIDFGIELGDRFTFKGTQSAPVAGVARERRDPKKQSEQQATVIELIGDVGAGKTTFVRGLAKGLGIEESITSPSFTISKSYAGKNKTLVHYDFYRLQDPGIMKAELEEDLKNPNNIIVIEWSDNIKNLLPKNHTIININYNDDNSREIKIS